MAGHWQSVREAADELGVAPETLTRRLRSGRPDGVAASGAPIPPPQNLPYPRPQPVGSSQTPPPLPKPPG